MYSVPVIASCGLCGEAIQEAYKYWIATRHAALAVAMTDGGLNIYQRQIEKLDVEINDKAKASANVVNNNILKN